MAHQGLLEEKITSIEYLDSRLIALVKQGLEEAGEDFRMLILPDHPNPLCYRTHTADPVPYVLYDSRYQRRAIGHYNEKEAAASGIFIPEGYTLLQKFLEE